MEGIMDANHVTDPHAEDVILVVSLELAVGKWKVALHDGRREKPAVHTVTQPQAAARLQAVLGLIEAHREKWSLATGVRIVVSYEAGQGISKQGNGRVRALLIEMAWTWLRYQPDSALTQWFNRRTQGTGPNRRARRIAIVAVARRLAIALSRYLKDGVIPEGAQMKPV
jgi:hypothetical protein